MARWSGAEAGGVSRLLKFLGEADERGTAERGPEKVERGRRWGRQKLSVVTDGTPEKGRRHHDFSHTERASVATIYP